MARKSEFIQFVKGVNKGDIVFINSISLSVTAIDKLREYIKTGVLHPVRKEVEKMITPTKIEEVMSGNIICPQMLYERGNNE